MSLSGLKHYLPRGLYGRAALILLLPVVVVQLVVSILFAERHFTDVTQQMTRNVIHELQLVFATIDRAPTPRQVTQELAARLPGLPIEVELVQDTELPLQDTRVWYDFSGTVFTPMLRETFPQIERILLGREPVVTIYAGTRHGMVRLTLSRRALSAAKPHQLFVHMLFFGILTTSIAYIYLRNQLRPITRLAAAAEAFGRGRHVPYAPAGATEVRAAGAAFLDMRQRIERYVEQRTLLLSGVSHDLRTPLTRMRLELSMLDADVRDALERDVDDMQRLVDEFLNFVQNTAEDEPEFVDPIALTHQIAEDARRAGQDVRVISAEGSGLIELRETAIRRALDNLISNAVRYGTRVELSVSLTEKALRWRVEDDGPGIPEEARAEAQKPFVRLDSARNQDRGAGVGLGLAIATDIARAHGGALRLGESARLGGLSADIVIAR